MKFRSFGSAPLRFAQDDKDLGGVAEIRKAGRSLGSGGQLFGSLGLETELAAGGGDVVSFLAAQGGCDAVLFEDGEKFFLAMAGRARPCESLNGVVGNEIYPGGKAAGMARERMGLLVGVIDSFDQDVFEGKPLFLA